MNDSIKINILDLTHSNLTENILSDFIKIQLQEILKVCEFTQNGKIVKVDGFILEEACNEGCEIISIYD